MKEKARKKKSWVSTCGASVGCDLIWTCSSSVDTMATLHNPDSTDGLNMSPGLVNAALQSMHVQLSELTSATKRVYEKRGRNIFFLSSSAKAIDQVKQNANNLCRRAGVDCPVEFTSSSDSPSTTKAVPSTASTTSVIQQKENNKKPKRKKKTQRFNPWAKKKDKKKKTTKQQPDEKAPTDSSQNPPSKEVPTTTAPMNSASRQQFDELSSDLDAVAKEFGMQNKFRETS